MTTVFLSHPPGMLEPYYGRKAIRALQSMATVTFNPLDGDISSEKVVKLAAGADIIVSYRQTAGDEALFLSLPSLQAFVRCSIDIRNVDVVAASRHGVLVTQASAGFVVAVSEWVVGVIIDLARSMSDYALNYRIGNAVELRMGRELRGATIGVIGYGQIGSYLCDLAHALGMRIVVHDPHVAAVHPSARRVGLGELLSVSDYVVCLAKATDDNRHLMNACAFSAMRPGACFVNASRGSLVDEAALLHALDSGKIAGCALDVGDGPDQMPTVRLASHRKVIATPHIGGLTVPAIEHQAMETVSQVEAIIAGREPVGAVNADSALRWHRSRDARKETA
ncbi:NAD(P)-dependent oxidoreductase [Polaromonas sp.]|uniref:NAD(P)-dependent oxidoreductase n=1 Tax=Polaromonas sp. TaxID=1869339 RepID=UPI00356739E8